MTLDMLPAPTRFDANGRNGLLAAPPLSTWVHRRDVTITIVLWVLLAVAAVWALSYVIGPLFIVVLAALFAHAVALVPR